MGKTELIYFSPWKILIDMFDRDLEHLGENDNRYTKMKQFQRVVQDKRHDCAVLQQ